MILKRLLVATLLLSLGAGGILGWRFAGSLPRQDGSVWLPDLQAEVRVAADSLGIPTIRAASRADAYRVLGFLHARDRLFQMDLARRKSAGRLAEVFGGRALDLDIRQRHYQAESAARAILRALPADQREILSAYAEGVNAAMESPRERPFEMLVLGYRPDPWRPEDSLLVAFGMFQMLTTQERDERMLTVMNRVLPPEVVAFLTPDTDRYAVPLLGGRNSRRPPRPTPAAAIRRLLREESEPPLAAAVDPDIGILGSNQWAVAGSKTRDGRAIVANDMHLDLGIPNIWYRAQIRYGESQFSGVTLPGLPLPVAGTNGHVAWGFTNVDSDVADLVRIDLDPSDSGQYRTPDGWRPLQRSVETIAVKNGDPQSIEVRATVWGPLLPEPLLEQPVALRWTALDPSGLNLKLLDIDRAENLEQAIAVMNRSGIPPQNVALADDRGHIAWTYAGHFPKRRGFDGSVALSWADGGNGWEGYLPPGELPRLVDPPAGFLATANNRTLGADYPHVVGHNFSHSYRAFRIHQRLSALQGIAESDMLQLQLDTESEFFSFYRQLILALAPDTVADPDLRDAATAAAAWNGRVDADSLGIPLLVEFRKHLMQSVFGPLLARCRRADAQFHFGWREAETPLRALLTDRSEETVPDRRFSGWDEFLRDALKSTVRRLKAEYRVERLDQLSWGRVNRVTVRHPFGRIASWLSPVLDMPELGSAGCSGHCVRVLSADKGASERFVISPARPGDGIFHMPGGQSGHPLSPHYRDQQQAWAAGRALPFAAGATRHELIFHPIRDTPR